MRHVVALPLVRVRHTKALDMDKLFVFKINYVIT